MSVSQFHRVMKTQLVTIQMDHSTVLVMMVILEMDSHVMVRDTLITHLEIDLSRVSDLFLDFHLDINECEPVSPCHANATCNNTIGSFNCSCNDGYTGDGFTCDGERYIDYSNSNLFVQGN